MCRICVEWQQGKLTNAEAFRNSNELTDPEHKEEVRKAILNKAFDDLQDSDPGELEEDQDHPDTDRMD